MSKSKIPSIKTVARRAGVSTATVSNVLTARRGVTPELAERVRVAVAELGYIADLGASRLRSRRSTVAGVMVPDIANPFFAAFVAAVEVAARADGYELLIVSSGEDPEHEAERLRALLTWRPAGVIVIPCHEDFAGRAVAASCGVPIVAADRLPQGADIDVIGVDNHRIGAEAARHLLDQGHRRLLVVASSIAVGNMRQRDEGIRDAAAGFADAQVETLEAGFGLAEERARIAARLARGARPDAIVALFNRATLAAFAALADALVAVPRDVALLGFDDDEWMHVVTPPVTAIVQPVEAMARLAWARLLARAGGDDGPPQDIRLDCTLEVRASSRGREEVRKVLATAGNP